MKAAMFVLLCLAAPLANAQASLDGSRFQISTGFALGPVLSGQQRDFVNNALTSSPGGVDYFGVQVDARTYFTKYLAAEASIDGWGLTSGWYGQFANNDVNVLQTWVVSTGVLLRFPPSSLNSYPIDVFFGGGINYNFLSYADGFNSHSSPSFQGGVGYYCKAGLTVLVVGPFFETDEVEFRQLTDQTGGGGTFNAAGFTVNIRVGMVL